MRTGLLVVVALVLATPAFAQFDLAGEWARDNHEDQPHRAPGAELGDYTGLPINKAARQKAESWDASILSQPEQQAKPHPAPYSMRGPQPNFRMTRVVDPITGRLIAYTMAGYFGRADRVIWMDGRKHPSEYAEHVWGGFSTGEWVGNALVVTTTHMKTTFINRNGPPSSYKATMVEWFTRHGDMLSHMSWIDDPAYLEEPMVRTNNFSLNPNQHVGPAIPFETVDELGDKETGWVPSWPIGERHDEFAKRFDIPFEATRGGKESLYPEYMKTIERLRKEEAAQKAPTTTARTQQ
jgi:hypothetical protein